MKKYYYLLLISFAAFMAASCTDDLDAGTAGAGTIKSGQPFSFRNVGDEFNGKKKMHYGEGIDVDTPNEKWPLVWDVNDVADVICPEARWLSDRHNETTDVPSIPYKVKELSGNSGIITPAEGDEDLCWGSNDYHHFFQAFPAGAVKMNVKKNIGDNANAYSVNFSANIPKSQKVTATLNSGIYTACDMKYAVLIGTDRIQRTQQKADEPIHLHYTPAFTAVEVTIKASQETDNKYIGDVISSIDISSLTDVTVGDKTVRKPIAGDFTGTIGYNEDGKMEATYANSETLDELSTNVRVEFTEPVELNKENHTLKVTVFLLPTAEAQVKVTVNRTKVKNDGTTPIPLTISKSFNKTGDPALAACKLNHINLGAMKPGETNPIDGNNWMSVLPDETYLSEMSIPGVYDCAAYASNVADAAQAQTPLKKANGTTTIGDKEVGEQMMAYLRAGNRVFDFKLSSAYDNSGNVSFNITRMVTTTTNTTFDFGEMVKGAQAWLYEHPTECVICVISDFNTEIEHSIDDYYSSATSVVSKRNGKTYTYDAYDFKVNEQERVNYNKGHELSPFEAGIKKFIEEETPPDLLLKKYDENLTLGEARGKVVIIDLSEYDDADGCVVKDFVVNTHPSPTSWFQDTRTIENEIALTEHTFGNGKMYIQDFLNLQRRDTYNAGSWIRPDNKPNTIQGASRSGNFDFDITKKKGYLDAAFAQACGDTDHKNWYLISTAARGWVNSTSLTTLYYSNAATGSTYNINGYTKNIANNASSGGTYQRLGMVLNAFAGTETYKEGNTGTNRTLEQIIWENNYKGNGPLTKSSATE